MWWFLVIFFSLWNYFAYLMHTHLRKPRQISYMDRGLRRWCVPCLSLYVVMSNKGGMGFFFYFNTVFFSRDHGVKINICKKASSLYSFDNFPWKLKNNKNMMTVINLRNVYRHTCTFEFIYLKNYFIASVNILIFREEAFFHQAV